MQSSDNLDIDSYFFRTFRLNQGRTYHMLFNNSISASAPPGSNQSEFLAAGFKPAFHEDLFYFCLSGLPKSIYTNVYGYHAYEYLRVFTPIRYELLAALQENRWDADVFMVTVSDDKQFGVIMSPRDGARLTAEEMAGMIGQIIQKGYKQSILKDDDRYCNVTALSEPFHDGFNSLRSAYLEARSLHAVSFFQMRPSVITRESLSNLCVRTDFQMITDSCERMCQALDAGDYTTCIRRKNDLFLHKLKSACSCELLDYALSFCRNMLQQRLNARRLSHLYDLNQLLSRSRFHRIEDCSNALEPLIRVLCSAVQEQGVYSKTILSALHYIHTRFTEDLSVGDIAEYAGVTPSYMSNEFKLRLGLPLRDYITQCRLQLAVSILESGEDLRICDICERVGIHDVKYFTRLFKKLTGMTPASYRSLHQPKDKA